MSNSQQLPDSVSVLRSWWKRLRGYLWKGFIVDVRAALVGSIVGAIVGPIVVAYMAAEEIEQIIRTDSRGSADPLHVLVVQTQFDSSPAQVSFLPPDLEGMRISESAYIVGTTYREILLRYVDRYSMCLDLSKTADHAYEVRPNLNSGALRKTASGVWVCKCSPPSTP